MNPKNFLLLFGLTLLLAACNPEKRKASASLSVNVPPFLADQKPEILLDSDRGYYKVYQLQSKNESAVLDWYKKNGFKIDRKRFVSVGFDKKGCRFCMIKQDKGTVLKVYYSTLKSELLKPTK